MGPANSTRVYDRFHPDTSSVPSTPSNNDITRQLCSGNTGSARANPERGNNRDYCLIRQLCLPDIPGREKGRGAMPSYQPEGTESVCLGRTLQVVGLHLLPDLIQQGDWMIKMDLSLQVPVHEAHQCFLLFGLSSAPRVLRSY